MNTVRIYCIFLDVTVKKKGIIIKSCLVLISLQTYIDLNVYRAYYNMDSCFESYFMISSITPNPDRLSLSQFPVNMLGVGDVIVPMRSTP